MSISGAAGHLLGVSRAVLQKSQNGGPDDPAPRTGRSGKMCKVHSDYLYCYVQYLCDSHYLYYYYHYYIYYLYYYRYFY